MDLQSDPRFSSNQARVRHRDEIRNELQGQLREKTTDEWIEILNARGVPAGPVNTVEEALNDPQIRHREMVIEVEHPGHGNVRMLGFPIKQTSDTPRLRHPAPDVGQHNREVLAEFGFSSADITRFAEAHVLAADPKLKAAG